MNRGYDSNDIFIGNKFKSQFLDFLEESVKKMKIRLFAYCIMDNHYHLVLENASDRLSDFQMLLNGQYGMYYRKMKGGKGYVFQSRFKSTLIENDSYLIQSICYLLRNPVRAGIVQLPEDYIWSSAKDYFSYKKIGIVDIDFVNDLFGSKEEFLSALHAPLKEKLPVVITKHGGVMGSNSFLKSALKKHDRRKSPTLQSKGVHRTDEKYFDPIEKVLSEFERMKEIDIEAIDTGTFEGKRLRGELVVALKERTGLKYREIAELDIFEGLSLISLRTMYKNYRSRCRKGRP
jgi:REP element-mobilizing transposase RayT